MADITVPSGGGRHTVQFNIADNGTTSDAIRIPPTKRLVAIQVPSQIDASSLTFTGSVLGTTFAAVTDPDGTSITVVIAASKYVLLPNLAGIPYLKFVLGTQQTTGTAGVTFDLIFENVGSSPYWHSGAVLAAT